jgi:hypothetical protein
MVQAHCFKMMFVCCVSILTLVNESCVIKHCEENQKEIMGASKIFCTYLLPCFLLENTKKIVFQTSNLPLTVQNK